MLSQEFIDKYIQSNQDALAKVMKSVKNIEEEVKKGQKFCRSVNHQNIDVIKDLEIKMTGFYGQLFELYVRLDALKKNKELAYYMNLKYKAEENGDKFTDAAATKEASFFVAEERRVREHINGIRESADAIVKTCRNLVNSSVMKTEIRGET